VTFYARSGTVSQNRTSRTNLVTGSYIFDMTFPHYTFCLMPWLSILNSVATGQKCANEHTKPKV